MPNGPIRRGQLIAPFGVGAMVVNRNGISMITAGLDHWYEYNESLKHVDVNEFRIHEWRLERILGKNHFRIPPDYRRPKQGDRGNNIGITVPFLRFPQYHYCNHCNLLKEEPLSRRGWVECPECRSKGKRRPMFQVPIVAICDHGHIQDFPWREWAHGSANPSCNKPLRLVWTGSTSLAGQRVKCDCGNADRPLSQVMSASPDGNRTELSMSLDKSGTPFLCQGEKPWLGSSEITPCDRPIRATLRSASNIYFAMIKSSVYLPRKTEKAPAELISTLEKPPISVLLNLIKDSKADMDTVAQNIIDNYPLPVDGYSAEQIIDALRVVLNVEPGDKTEQGPDVAEDDPETAFRRAEFNILRNRRNEEFLKIREVDIKGYEKNIGALFSRITLVDKLRETRVLAGFTRVFPENEQEYSELASMLWKNEPEYKNSWLPAFVVFGEGIFIEFHEKYLQRWEKNPIVQRRVGSLIRNYSKARTERRLRDREISPRLVLLHTFAHILINRLVFECGYSSASLRERLYISSHEKHPMAGILIYTSAGDSEGTMGGLVRMGKPGFLEPIIQRALEGARWCSADPVCMEVAMHGGQGPDSCNLAACHSCALVPETACEEFNRFLDRGVVIGDPNSAELGYFQNWR